MKNENEYGTLGWLFGEYQEMLEAEERHEAELLDKLARLKKQLDGLYEECGYHPESPECDHGSGKS